MTELTILGLTTMLLALILHYGEAGIMVGQPNKIDLAKAKTEHQKMTKNFKEQVSKLKKMAGGNFHAKYAESMMERANETEKKVDSITEEIAKMDPKSEQDVARMNELQGERLEEKKKVLQLFGKEISTLDSAVKKSPDAKLKQQREVLKIKLEAMCQEIIDEADALDAQMAIPTVSDSEESKKSKLTSKVGNIQIKVAEECVKFCRRERSRTSDLEEQTKRAECEKKFADKAEKELDEESKRNSMAMLGATSKEKEELQRKKTEILKQQKMMLSQKKDAIDAKSKIIQRKLKSISDPNKISKLEGERDEAMQALKEVKVKENNAEIELLDGIMDGDNKKLKEKAMARMAKMNEMANTDAKSIMGEKENKAKLARKSMAESIGSNTPDLKKIKQAAASQRDFCESQMMSMKTANVEHELMLKKLEQEDNTEKMDKLFQDIGQKRSEISLKKQEIQACMESMTQIADSACKLGDRAAGECEEAIDHENNIKEEMTIFHQGMMDKSFKEKQMLTAKTSNIQDVKMLKIFDENINKANMMGTQSSQDMVDNIEGSTRIMSRRLENGPQELKSRMQAMQLEQMNKAEQANGAVSDMMDRSVADAKARMSSMKDETMKKETESIANEMEAMKTRFASKRTEFEKSASTKRDEIANTMETMKKEGKSWTGETFAAIQSKAKVMTQNGDKAMGGIMSQMQSFGEQGLQAVKNAGA